MSETNRAWCSVSGLTAQGSLCDHWNVDRKDRACEREIDGGRKYYDLILFSASFFSWFFPLVEPNKIPEAKGAPCCVHLDVDALQPEMSRNTSAIEQLIGFIARYYEEECGPWRTLLSLSKGTLGLISRMGAANR